MAEQDTIRFTPSVKRSVIIPFAAVTAALIIGLELAWYIKFGKSFWFFAHYRGLLPDLFIGFCWIWVGAGLMAWDVRCYRFELNLDGIHGHDAWNRRRFISWQSIVRVKVRNYLLWQAVLVFEKGNRWPVHLRKGVLQESNFVSFLRTHLDKTSTLYEATAT